jgi:hypothetical protein
MRVVVEYRFVISLALSVVVGVSGLRTWPFPHENPLLGLIEVSRPMVYASFCYAYATVWFSTPFFLFNIVFSLAYIFLAPANRQTAIGTAATVSRVRGSRQICSSCSANSITASLMPAPEPRGSSIPERGLYTGMAIVGAVGTGRPRRACIPTSSNSWDIAPTTSAQDRRLDSGGEGGLLSARSAISWHDTVERAIMSKSASRRPTATTRCTTSSMRTRWPTGSPTLMTNLFGRGKEPFWQQASTNLVKFRDPAASDALRLCDAVPGVRARHQPGQARTKIAEGERRFTARNRRIVVDKREHLFTDV